MGLLGDIRYTLTQSHYKRTTLCVCACVCVLERTVQACFCDPLRETNVGGVFVSALDSMDFISHVCLYTFYQ